jgi:DNA-binding CsgD family transcriptional regulator
MPFQTATLLAVGTLLSGGLVALAFALRARFNLRFLDIYSYFASVVAGYGLLNWIGPSLIQVTSNADDSDAKSAIFLFIVIAVPLALVKLWLFLLLLAAMLEETLNQVWTRLLVLLAATAMPLSCIAIYADIGENHSSATISFVTLFGVLVLSLNFVAVFRFLAAAENMCEPALQKHARRFGWTYLIGYLVYALPYYLLYFADLPWYVSFAPFIYYLLHLVPVIFIWQFAQQLHRDGFSRVTRASSIDRIVKRHRVSSREKAILLLVIDGLNNSEIADRLSISPNTVRNHIYNIYKKLGVKNRTQLRRLCDG